MAEVLTPDICVVGAGSGGLVVASGAALMGASVVLVEKHLMGGDCLNFGCVPSKAMIAAAAMASLPRRSRAFGIDLGEPRIDFARVQAHVRDVIEQIAPNDSVERYRGMGVKVVQAAARFTGPDEVEATGTRIRARRFVIATGSSPMVPPIPGLDRVSYFTNETIFENRQQPAHLIVVGGGPIGLELAQAHRRLGSAVSVIEMASFLPKDDPEPVELVLRSLRRDGVELIEGARVVGVEPAASGVAVTIERENGKSTLSGSHLLLAVGRKATVEGLGLEVAGVAYSGRGVQVDRRQRTTNRRVFAVGDVTGGLQFTHAASYQAGIALRNILFRLPAKADHRAFPWVTYTSPELASVGMQETEARRAVGTIRVLRWPLGENDRAVAERDTDGFIKVITDRRGRVLGAQIVASRAGDLILPWVMAVAARTNVRTMAGVVVPYPTVAEIGKRAAGSFFEPALSSARTRGIVRFLARFG
jgi:pyruvate/2-oxoglutarate dehydrogenase complex dihydrolipoamide dehydrogenase (E3) component